ncbi:MAG: S8 family serine peptidase, partial [Phycisphaerae bacterium]
SLQAAAQVPGVYSIKPVPTDGGLRGEMSDQVNVDNVDGTNLAFPGYQAWLAAAGVDGTGVVIANVDGGVQDTHPDLVGRIIACTGTTCGGGATSSHGTHTAGIMAADGSSGTLDGFGFLRGLGVAPGANLVEQVYSPFFQNPGGMLLLMTDSYNNGASLSGNSWGPSGSPQGYDDDTRQVDVGVRDADPNAPGNQPLTFVLSFMNGNGGTSTQGTPDEAKNLFNIGSTKMQTSGGTQILQIDDISSNSAHGPALDGRTIPHMVAPGCYVDSTVSTNTWGTMCGTSMASPHVSGAVALFIQYYRNLPGGPPDPSPALIKAAFLPVSRDLAGHLDADGGVLGHPFDSKQGWGRMELQKVVDPQVSVRYFDAPQIFDNTGEIWTTTVSAADPAQPLKVMLVWTDAPGHGLGGSTPAWNNNLDLEVQSGANLYRGNNFAASGWSQTGGVADGMNNTEGVFIGPTASGAFTIRVIASNITSDGVPNQGDGTDQDFALACYNCAIDPDFTINATPGAQSLCAPADAVYTVDVGQLVGFTDPVTLSTAGAPAGSTASFSTNPVTPPGSSVLTISNTGAVAAGSYAFDIVGASTTGTHSFPVTLDIFDTVPTPPAALTPTDGATDVPLVPTFTWTGVAQASTYDIEIATDAAFTAVVDSATVSDVTYTPGTALATITTYYWHVRASNPCGTGSYGATASFTTLDTPPILLVDDDDNSPDVRSFYTGALDALGLTYDTWDTNNTDNEPSATQLAPYSLVIWFTGDEFGGAAGPGAAGEAALATWLDQGNCLFISSQDYYYDRGITAFMTGYLGIASASSDVGQTSVTGAGTVFGGMGPYTLSYPFTNYSDNVNVGAGAEVSFVGNQGNTAVNKDSGVYQTTFWTFPFEAVPNLSDRTALLSAVLNLCNPAPPVPACPTVRGDMTGADGVNGDDIRLFVICYLTGDPWKPGCGCSDMNMSGAYESEDMTLFVDCLLTEACP